MKTLAIFTMLSFALIGMVEVIAVIKEIIRVIKGKENKDISIGHNCEDKCYGSE